MRSMMSLVFLRLFPLNKLGLHPERLPWLPLAFQRSVRHQAFDANLDQDQLAEARKWHQSFQLANIPAGNTIFSRSSGPGGQHVNKFVFLKPSFGAHLLLQCLLTSQGRKPKPQPHGPSRSCSACSPSICTPACARQSTMCSATMPSASRPKPTEAGPPTQTTTDRSCLMRLKSCTEGPSPIRQTPKRLVSMRHCE